MTQLTTNPYAPPESPIAVKPDEGDHEIWREGKFVVCRRTVHLPERCVVCNEPAAGHGIARKMGWHSPWLFLLILGGLLLYVVVALCLHKSARVRFSLCGRHRARRRLGMWIGVGGLFLSVACLVSPAFVDYGDHGLGEDIVPITGLIGLLVCPIIGVIMTQMIRPRRIDHELVWLRVGKAFADAFPERG